MQKNFGLKWVLLWLGAGFSFAVMAQEGVGTDFSPANRYSNESTGLFYAANKAVVMRLLDKKKIAFEIDQDGDLVYRLAKNNWHGYIIFGEVGSDKIIWNLQVRTQFEMKSGYYRELLEFANNWNLTQKVPKIAIKSPAKLVLSINYPVQYGFNPVEFEKNVFDQLNRSTEIIANKIQPMIKVNAR